MFQHSSSSSGASYKPSYGNGTPRSSQAAGRVMTAPDLMRPAVPPRPAQYSSSLADPLSATLGRNRDRSDRLAGAGDWHTGGNNGPPFLALARSSERLSSGETRLADRRADHIVRGSHHIYFYIYVFLLLCLIDHDFQLLQSTNSFFYINVFVINRVG